MEKGKKIIVYLNGDKESEVVRQWVEENLFSFYDVEYLQHPGYSLNAAGFRGHYDLLYFKNELWEFLYGLKNEVVKEMKPPLPALLIAPDHKVRDAIHRGNRKTTVREGYRDYRPGGPLMLCCEKTPWAVKVEITGVRHCIFGKVTEEEYKASGFRTREELLKGLQRFYPDINWDSPATVIRWENPQGRWVDYKDLYSYLYLNES